MCAAAKGYSVHIGLNYLDPAHYQGWDGELNACEADADDMEALASSLGYSTHKLIRERATREAVIDAIRAAAQTARTGDMFLLSCSAHGGQMPNAGAEDEPDGMDETWCLFDGQLIDDELRLLWQDFAAGVRIVVVSDTCNSGTVTRVAPPFVTGRALAPAARIRSAPAPVMRRVFLAHRGFYTAIQVETKSQLLRRRGQLGATVRLLAACPDGQDAADGQENGAFTAALLEAWNFGRFDGNYAAFHRAILDAIRSDQAPQHNVIGRANPQFDAQRPFVIGESAVRSASIAAAGTRSGDTNQRATLAIEGYLADKRPNELGIWRASKPKSDWGMRASAWRGVGHGIIGRFNAIDPNGAQIDGSDNAVDNAVRNLHDEPLGVFHQYLVDKANERPSRAIRLGVLEDATREAAE